MLGFAWGLAGCELIELVEPVEVNEISGLEVVWIQTTPPVAAPSSLFFVNAAIANPGLEELRAFAFTCLPETDDCGAPLGLLVTELALRCGVGASPPCVDVRASAGLQLPEELVAALPIEQGQPVDAELPLFVAACPAERCPLALTDPVASPVTTLGLDGSGAPPDDVDRGDLAVSVRTLIARPSVEDRDSNPGLALIDAFDDGEVDLTFRVTPGGRGSGIDASGFTTGGRFTTGGDAFERTGLVRGDVFRFVLEPPRPVEPTTVWVILEERGTSAGAVFADTFFGDGG